MQRCSIRQRWAGALVALVLGCVAMGSAQAQPMIAGITTTPVTPVQIQQPVQFLADASVAGGGALEYRWDFGDGTPRTPWVTSSGFAHAYLRAGTFTVLLQVRDASLALASATHTLVVRLAPAAAARYASSMIVHPTRREAWVVNPDHGTVSVIDIDALTRIDEVVVGAQPASIAVDNAGQLWIAVRGDDALKRVDPATRTVTAVLDLGYGAAPVAVVIAPDGVSGYLGLTGPGRVRRFSPATAQLGPQLALGAHVEAMAIKGDGTALLVSRLVSEGASGTLWRVDLPAFASAQSVSLPLDTTSPDSGTAGRGLPNYVGALALADDGVNLWYGGKKDNILRGMHREMQPLTFETVLRSLVGRVDIDVAQEQVAQRMDLDNAGRVAALLLPPGSSHLFVAQDGNGRVLVLDPWNRREVARMNVGVVPQGLAFDGVTGRLFVRNDLSRSVSVFDVSDLLRDGVTAPLAVATIPTTLLEVLSETVLRGKRVFHDASDVRMSQDGYIACASCHLGGRGDGRVWDFTQLGEGLRNTTSLRGSAGLGRGLVHWSGNFDEIQDFEVPMRNLFGGIGFMDDADYFADGRNHPLGPAKAGFSTDLDALAAYVSSLDEDDRSPFRNPDGSLTSDAMAGRALFTALDCQRCHAGSAFTDSGQGLRHDVGTLGPGSGQRLGAALLALDTPSLSGLFASAPYLHDGSATTLDDVLTTRNINAAHGDFAAVNAAQRSALVAFLNQIDGAETGVAAPASLLLTAPVTQQVFAPQQLMTLSIQTDLPQITSVEYLVDGVVVANATSVPWTAQWTVSGEGSAVVNARVVHDQGRFNSLSAATTIVRLSDGIFAHGFEITGGIEAR
jgi:large repetitive protein